jgi:hypothetical protein
MACRVLSVLIILVEIFAEFEEKADNVHLYTRYGELGREFNFSVIGPLHVSAFSKYHTTSEENIFLCTAETNVDCLQKI